MHEKFVSYILRHRLLSESSKALLAVSGGMDSMAMVDLFHQSGWPFAIAHVNFQLRGADADRDQQLVEETAKRLEVPFFVQTCDTQAEARKSGESIQMAARRLRYAWMEKIRSEHGYHAIATAHHIDDAIETLLINITRGTGIAGLKSIPVKTGHIIRPLLFANRDEVAAYCHEKGLSYREDLSNKETKYARNKIRHKVLPALKELNPSLSSTMARFFERMAATEDIYAEMISQQKQLCTRKDGDQLLISLPAIRALPWPAVILYEMIRDYGFSESQCADLLGDPYAQPGKAVHADTHSALVDRTEIIVYPTNAYPDRKTSITANVYVDAPTINQTDDEAGHTVVWTDRVFHFYSGEMKEQIVLPDGPRALMADLNKLAFPLVIRPWKAGDAMVPIGMKGKKKVSDLLTDVKMPRHHKENVPVVTTARDEIIWVVGVRADDRFKITPETKRYLYAYI